MSARLWHYSAVLIFKINFLTINTKFKNTTVKIGYYVYLIASSVMVVLNSD